jgi:hypothetical protein
MRYATILVVILAFVPFTSTTAQLQPGERVRVTRQPICPPNTSCAVRPPQKIVGTLLSVSGDSLLLATDGGDGQVVVPLVSASRIQVVRGSKRATSRGTGIGAVLGGVLGLVGAVATYQECEGFCPADFGPGGTAVGGLLLGGLLGAGVGAVVGSLVTIDRWVDMPVQRMRVSLGPQPHGRFGFGASVTF